MILGKVDFSSPIERELLTLNHAKQYENPTWRLKILFFWRNITKLYNNSTTRHGMSSVSRVDIFKHLLGGSSNSTQHFTATENCDMDFQCFDTFEQWLGINKTMSSLFGVQQNVYPECRCVLLVFLFEFWSFEMFWGEEKGPIFCLFLGYGWCVLKWWFHRKNTNTSKNSFWGEFDLCHPKQELDITKDGRNVAHGKDRRKLSSSWKHQHYCIQYQSLSNFNMIRGFSLCTFQNNI